MQQIKKNCIPNRRNKKNLHSHYKKNCITRAKILPKGISWRCNAKNIESLHSQYICKYIYITSAPSILSSPNWPHGPNSLEILIVYPNWPHGASWPAFLSKLAPPYPNWPHFFISLFIIPKLAPLYPNWPHFLIFYLSYPNWPHSIQTGPTFSFLYLSYPNWYIEKYRLNMQSGASLGMSGASLGMIEKWGQFGYDK